MASLQRCNVRCRAKRAAKTPRAEETRQLANLREQIIKRINDIVIHSSLPGLAVTGFNTAQGHTDELTGNERLPADYLFAPSNWGEPPEDNFDVDDADAPEGQTHSTNGNIGDRLPTEPPTIPALPMLAENMPISLPSTVAACSVELKLQELALRQTQADSLLKALREVIAEKSMQYSHTMRGAGRQIIKTRSRDRIATLNTKRNDLTYTYGRCREAMITLGADETVLAKYRALSRDDITSNTTVVNPNVAGSTTLHLSWIWHVGRDDESAPAALHESESAHPFVSLACVTQLTMRMKR